MSETPIFNIREAVEREIKDRLDYIISRLTPIKPTRDEFDRRYCDDCGEMLLCDAKFCHNCGRKIL